MMSSIFIYGFIILSLFNVQYVLMFPNSVYTMGFGFISGLLIDFVAVILLAGFHIAGSGLGDEALHLITGVIILLNIMFQIEVAGYPIGLGLANNVLVVFPLNEMFGFGFFLATILVSTIFISGICLILGVS